MDTKIVIILENSVKSTIFARKIKKRALIITLISMKKVIVMKTLIELMNEIGIVGYK